MPKKTLAKVKSKKHPSRQNIKIAVDNCIFTIKDTALHILLIQMRKKPFTDMWALPGGLIKTTESLDAAARRILKEETSVSDIYLEQLYTFSQIKRDPFGRVISIAYFALIPEPSVDLKTMSKYKDVRWWKSSDLPKLAYDHSEIAKYARERLVGKIGYTNIVWSLMPRKFTLTELQETYEAILEKNLDKRNFRKKVLSLDLIKAMGEKTMRGAHRPAMLYRFRSREPRIVEIL